MKIVELKVLRGPNYWSNYHKKLILIKLDLESYKDVMINQIVGFNEKLKRIIPSLFNYQYSAEIPHGLFKRLEENTLLSHIIEYIALELQCLAGMACDYGRTRNGQKKGQYFVAFSYQYEKAGILAAQTAVTITHNLAMNQDYDRIELDIQELKKIKHNEQLGPSTEALIKEAEKRKIPHLRLDDLSLILLGQGCNQKMIRATITSNTSLLGADFASDKDYTKKLLEAEFIPVPQGDKVITIEELDKVIVKLGFPLVIKPINANHGRGVSTNIRSREIALQAFTLAKSISECVLVERYIQGNDYRVLVVNYNVVAVARRQPPIIRGNGKSTVMELINELNSNPLRGEGHENILTKIEIDNVTSSILTQEGLNTESVLSENKMIALKYAANISTGGTAEDVTELMHPKNAFLMQRIARLINLDICGIDLIARDISIPITLETGAIIEINAAPGLRMHLQPSKGKKQNVAKKIIDMLFPLGTSARIPIVAVTGTNGKTTVVRLVAYMASFCNYHVGFTTTEGIYINNVEVYRGDCSGPSSGLAILRDPFVNFAVLECARGGIIRTGLAFDQCDISIVTNISEDHLGIADIETVEEMARVKSVVPRSTKSDGFAILNADDDLVYGMIKDIKCKVGLFSMISNNEKILHHIQEGGLAVYIKKDCIMLANDNKIIEFMLIKDIPITFCGKATSMVKNILPCILVGIAKNFSFEAIKESLKSFYPDAESLPGRMNLFKLNDFSVLIDYAHNVEAFMELKEYLKSVQCKRKIGIIAATGDRREIDIINLGSISAEIFDEIIIRYDKDPRGRTHKQLTELLILGIRKVKPYMTVKVIPDEFEAINYAMNNAQKETFIFYFPDDVLKAIEHMKLIVAQYENIPIRLIK